MATIGIDNHPRLKGRFTNVATLVLIVLIFITLLVTLFWPFSPSGINTFDPYCLGVAHAIAMPEIEMQAAAAGRLCGRPLL